MKKTAEKTTQDRLKQSDSILREDLIELRTKLKYLYHIDTKSLDGRLYNISETLSSAEESTAILENFFLSFQNILYKVLKSYDFLFKQYLDTTLESEHAQTPPVAAQLFHCVYTHQIYSYFIAMSFFKTHNNTVPITGSIKSYNCGGAVFNNDLGITKHLNAPCKTTSKDSVGEDFNRMGSNWDYAYTRFYNATDNLSYLLSYLYENCDHPTPKQRTLVTSPYHHNWIALLIKKSSFITLDEKLTSINKEYSKNNNSWKISTSELNALYANYNTCYSEYLSANSKYNEIPNKIIFSHNATNYLGFDFINTILNLERNAGKLTINSYRSWIDMPNLDSILTRIQNLPLTLRSNILNIIACNYESRESLDRFDAINFLKTLDSLLLPLANNLWCYMSDYLDALLADKISKNDSTHTLLYKTCYDVYCKYFQDNCDIPFLIRTSTSKKEKIWGIDSMIINPSKDYADGLKNSIDFIRKINYMPHATTFSKILQENYIIKTITKKDTLTIKALIKYFECNNNNILESPDDVSPKFFTSIGMDSLDKKTEREKIKAQYFSLLHSYSLNAPNKLFSKNQMTKTISNYFRI